MRSLEKYREKINPSFQAKSWDAHDFMCSAYTIDLSVLTDQNLDLNALDSESVLSLSEKMQLKDAKDPINFLTKRWLIKSSFHQLLDSETKHALAMQSIEFHYTHFGKPYLYVIPQTQSNFKNQIQAPPFISISDEAQKIASFVLTSKNQTINPIAGIGIDIVDQQRIQKAHQNHPHHFANKVLTEQEHAALQTTPNATKFLAHHWAIKEATAKALGTGFQYGVQFSDIQYDNGKDTTSIQYSGKTKRLIESKEITQTLVDTIEYKGCILAFVVMLQA